MDADTLSRWILSGLSAAAAGYGAWLLHTRRIATVGRRVVVWALLPGLAAFAVSWAHIALTFDGGQFRRADGASAFTSLILSRISSTATTVGAALIFWLLARAEREDRLLAERIVQTRRLSRSVLSRR